MTARSRIPIGIAVVEYDGCYLVGVRGDGGPLAGYAEFPGGKCRSGESPEHCAIRECEEEAGLRVKIIELLCRTPYDYPHAQVDLHFYLCRPADPTLVATRHQGFKWRPRSDLGELSFPPANQPVIKRLLQHVANTE